MSNEKSCVGCKFLFSQDDGYSNYTVLDTTLDCIKGRNPNLPADDPYDRTDYPDNFPATKDSRCELYVSGPHLHFDVDGDNTAQIQTDDPEVLEAHGVKP